MNRLPLIDELIADRPGLMRIKRQIGGKWYVAKPLPYYGWRNTVLRIKSAWAVLTGKAIAVQYAEDAPRAALPASDLSGSEK